MTGVELHERLRAAAETGDERLLELLAELEGDELAEAVVALSPAAGSEQARRLLDDGAAGGLWGRS
ncbi:hypothetical protein [Conexibacter sp. CPCC 206217]|uniref:hypothetical protein n=1 Tax=Conexibacter sp. CPCC 206217 TaxID=3064574 RepID=UPI0027169BA9|nr:hypothetical protein [Conexibacter sp. CPCC 206217]MDO8213526.1 hypothetical protein [Conexibacter sp. CPCC 206217]